MSTFQSASDPAKSGLLDYRHAGPTVLRMVVGTELRRLRESRGITREDARETIRASESKMSRLELGRTRFKPRDVADLLTLYGVADDAERATLLALAEQANVPGWWHTYGDLLPGWFEPYLGLEQAATVIRTYEVQFVPGLLQCEDYARAVIELGHADDPKTEIERRVSLRMRRQQILHRADPPSLWAVIDEAALRRPIGGTATMRSQLRHLIEIAQLPHVTIQVVPFSAGGHAAAGGPITILRFPQGRLPDVVYLEHITAASYPDKPADIDHYKDVMNRLVVEVEPPTATTGTLHRILDET
jgi:transcriptional regulator with XRE-family HTH domain